MSVQGEEETEHLFAGGKWGTEDQTWKILGILDAELYILMA